MTFATVPTGRTAHLLGLALAAATLLLLVLSSGALGILGDGGRPDRVYVVVLAVAVGGAALARLRPRGTARALLAAAGTVVVVSATALLGGLHGDGSVLDVVAVTALLAALLAVAAWLCWRAATGSATDDREPRGPREPQRT